MLVENTAGSAPDAGQAGESVATGAAQDNAATTSSQTDGGEQGEQSGASKTFTQQELDEIVRRRVAKAESKAERRVLRTLEQIMPARQAPQEQQTQANDGRPTRRDGEADDTYFDRLTDWKLEQRDRSAQQSRQQEQARTLAKKTETIYAEAQKISGFDREAFDDLPLTKPMVEALIESDASAKLMHYMASHPEEVERIASLSATRQAVELGKLEAKATEARPPSRSNAPAALGSAKGTGSQSGMPDPADTKAWIRAANEAERSTRR